MALRNLKLASVCAAVLASNPALANESTDLGALTLEQLMDMDVNLVYGASRYEQRLTDAPASISIVTSDEIRRFGYSTMTDVLRNVRGMYITNDRNYSYVGLRGFLRPGDYSTRVLVLIDGHRMNDNLYDAGGVGREAMIGVELIDRVEVIRGPSSSVYGSSAFLGVINVVTKQGAQVKGAELAVEGDSMDGYTARAIYGTETDSGIDWLVSASHYSSDGDDRIYYSEFDDRITSDPRARNGGLAIDMDDEDASKFFTSMSYGDVSASAYYSKRAKQVPTASFEAIFAEPDNRSWDVRGYADLAYEHAFSEALTVKARGFYDYMGYEGALPYDYEEVGDSMQVITYRDEGIGEWLGAELQLNAKLADRYTLVLGAEYRSNFREDQLAFEDRDPVYYSLDDESSSEVVGLFAQGEASLREDLSVTAGLRYDHYGAAFGGTLNPRVAVIYHPTPASAVKALFGDAFRAPNPYERYYYYGIQQTQPALEPETIRTYELVYEHYLTSEYRLNLSAYTYDIDGLITQTETLDGDPYYANIDAVRARGVEVEVEAKYENGTVWRASFAEQRAEDVGMDRELSSSPHHLGKLSTSVPIYARQLYANLEVQYHSESFTFNGARSPDFVLTNLSFNTHDLWKGIELSAGIYNLLDTEHVYPAAQEHLQTTLEQDGRTYRGKLTVRF
ncbi:MAG TPA: TonB-dependent receptor [Steroidobacteraceae bacterium]|nr:TonB-dependent receptor [Steroidobacteraceae bacterium]